MNTFIMKNDLAGHGEDAAFVCDGFAVVCDGLGGSGQGKVNFDGEEQTEAKTASTLCSLAVREFFNEAVINDWRTFMAENLSPDDRREYRERQLDLLADKVSESLDMELVHRIIGEGM